MRHHLALFAILSALLLAAPAQAVDPECIDPVGTETIVWEADEVPLLRICTPADPADRALSHVVPFLAHSGDRAADRAHRAGLGDGGGRCSVRPSRSVTTARPPSADTAMKSRAQ